MIPRVSLPCRRHSRVRRAALVIRVIERSSPAVLSTGKRECTTFRCGSGVFHAVSACAGLWEDRGMLRWLPAGIPLSLDQVRADLARRKLGYGRGARMKFEQDELAFSGGVRHGFTLGSPVALRIGNTEWPKWHEVMSAEPVADDRLGRGRGALLTRPRPGHADLVGMQKYGFDE